MVGPLGCCRSAAGRLVVGVLALGLIACAAEDQRVIALRSRAALRLRSITLLAVPPSIHRVAISAMRGDAIQVVMVIPRLKSLIDCRGATR